MQVKEQAEVEEEEHLYVQEGGDGPAGEVQGVPQHRLPRPPHVAHQVPHLGEKGVEGEEGEVKDEEGEVGEET